MTKATKKTTLKTQPTLTTPRLILNQFTLDDVSDVNAICSNKAIADTTAYIPHPYTKEMATEWIQTHDISYREGKSAIYAIRSNHLDNLIGAISLVIDQISNLAELGYWVREEEWGKGY